VRSQQGHGRLRDTAIGMVDHPRQRMPLCEGILQRRERQPGGQCALQRPAHDLAGIGIEPHRQIHTLALQPDGGAGRDPELIDPGQREATGEIQLHLQVLLGIGHDHEGPRLDRQQVVCPHEPPHPFVVDQEAAPPEFRCEAPVALPAPVGDGDSLNGRPHGPLFFHGLVCLPRPVEPRSAHLG
jgi:hypothetical protein